ncbi:hypothetical protein [uncultured Bacteroides sp.]|nr:hypothetical protein [uncultured Bacteroides sp.]
MDRILLWQTVRGCGHWCGRRLQERKLYDYKSQWKHQLIKK